jgi:hypothetical protein
MVAISDTFVTLVCLFNLDEYLAAQCLQIARGEIPGVPGKDYPVNSVTALKNTHKGIQNAPPDLVTPDYPGSGERGTLELKPDIYSNLTRTVERKSQSI